jgi:hypothetical protein
MRVSLQILLLLGSSISAAFSVAAQQPTGFVEPVIRIAVGASEGTGTVTLKSTREQPSAPRLEDIALPQPAATVKLSPLEGTQQTPSSTWRYRIDITGLVPVAVTQQRYAKVTYADQKTETFSYTVSNQAASAFSWAISKPPDPWASSEFPSGPGCTSFSVTPKDSVATDVKITAALVEGTTKGAITGDKLRLCTGKDPCKDDKPIELLPANVPTQLMLCTTKTFHGTFTGPVTLVAREKPEGEAILQKAEFSSFLAKLLGFILIVIGVAIAWLAKVYARARLERDQALLPAIEMRVQIESLRSRLESIDEKYASLCKNVRDLITSLLEQLSTDELDRKQLLPQKFPNPFAPPRDNAAAYKQYLEERNAPIQLLATLIKEGIVRAAAKDTGTIPPEKIKTAVLNIDAIATAPLPTSSQALSLIKPILATLEPAAALNAEPERPLTAVQEFNIVSLEIETISKAVWIIYALLTALTGLVVLILNDPGFGTPLDFVYAFFWGFGLPTTVTALTSASAATALNISIART